MPDLRTVLTETLAHTLRIHPYGPDLPYGFGEYADRIATELADRLLGLPGVAVTQLPEPDSGGDDNHGGSWSAWPSGVAVVQPAGKVIAKGLSLTPIKARELAADLLAAALSVEGNTNP